MAGLKSRRSVVKSFVGIAFGSAVSAMARGASAATKRRAGEICRKDGECESGVCGKPDRTVRRYCQANPITCPFTVRSGPPTQIDITVRDSVFGISPIVVTQSNNADTPVPPFTVGTTDPLVITATKIDQTQTAHVEIIVSDLAGASTTCDYDF